MQGCDHIKGFQLPNCRQKEVLCCPGDLSLETALTPHVPLLCCSSREATQQGTLSIRRDVRINGEIRASAAAQVGSALLQWKSGLLLQCLCRVGRRKAPPKQSSPSL